MSHLNYILGGDSLTVVIDSTPYTVNKQSHTYQLVLNAVKSGDVDAVRSALNIRQHITQSLSKKSNDVVIDGNDILYKGMKVTGLISSRIFEVIRQGLDVTPMVRFLENLMDNPSKRAVDELFGFLEACKLPITPDGHFLAYKRVRADYKDCHSGTMDNSVGQVLEMPRNMVDEDKNRTCSAGLHFCSYDYLQYFSGERIVVVKINPRDVVAIPADYNNSKGRTCRYEVVDELPMDEVRRMPTATIPNDYVDDYYVVEDEEDDDDWDDDDDDWAVPGGWSSPAQPVAPAVASVNTTGKLTPKEVREIRRLLSKGDTLAGIARKYGVSARTIGRIRDGEAWSSV